MNKPKYSDIVTHKYNATNPSMPKPRIYPDALKELHSKYHVGQRVYYTGPTTYDRNVTNELATIDVLGKSIHLLLDEHHKPYKDNNGIDVLPQDQRATVSIGDLKSGTKKIMPVS